MLEGILGPSKMSTYKKRLAAVREMLVGISRKSAELTASPGKGKLAQDVAELAGCVDELARVLIGVIDSLPGETIQPKG